MRLQAWMGMFVMGVLALGGTGVFRAAVAEEIVIGGQCDRTGPTKLLGIQACAGILDLRIPIKEGV